MASSLSPSAAPRVAVVTVSYGSAEVLSPFLRSLASASSFPLDAVVVDNKAAEADNVRELAARHGVRYLPLASNVGYGGAVNAAARMLPPSIDWVLVANPDLVMSTGSVDVLVAAGDEDPTIGSVGPATLTSTGEIYPSARSVPSLRNGIGHALFSNIWIDNPWTRAYRNDTDQDPHRRDAGWLSGACVLVRRSAFDELGGFDEGFFMYFEDVDLGFRLGKNGYRNLYEPAAVVTHTGAHSTTTESSRMIAAHHESARRFLTKKYSGALLWPLRLVLTLGLRLRSAALRRSTTRH